MSVGRAENRELLDNFDTFLRRYYKQEVNHLAKNYPNDQQSLYIDWTDLYQYDADLADDYLDKTEQVHEYLEEALRLYDLPVDIDLSGASVRVTNVDRDSYVCGIPEIQQKSDVQGTYRGIEGVLERVSGAAMKMTDAAFECQRCGGETMVPQGSGNPSDFQEPHECQACERQGPFQIDFNASEYEQWRKLQLSQPPDEIADKNGTGEKLTVHVDGSLATAKGLKKRAGEAITAYGIVEMEQQGSGKNKTALFKPYLNGKAISFEDANDDLDVDDHREEVHTHANADDCYDRFISNMAPGIEPVGNWPLAFELGAVYLFAAPRIEQEDGSIHRGDIHFLLIGDPGTAKSKMARVLATLSPGSEHRSATGLSSDVGLTAAAVSDSFSETDDATLQPGILPRADDHVIFEEIDKTDVEMTKINDALEGRQVVTVDKWGMSATLKTRVGFMATGNPEEGRFIDERPVKDQIEIETSLLTRFDGVVVITDTPDEEDDEAISGTMLGSYREDAAREKAEREGGDPDDVERETTARSVSQETLRAWVMLGRDEFPLLTEAAETRLQEWYVDVRSMGASDTIPATARTLMAGIRFSVAYARMRLSETVEECDVERAIELSKGLIGQTHDVASGGFDADHFTEATPKSKRDRVQSLYQLVSEMEDEYDEGAPRDKVEDRAKDELGLSKDEFEHELDHLRTEKGEVYAPVTGRLRTT